LGQTVSYRFAYGTSANGLTNLTPMTAGVTGTAATAVSATISGLNANTTYYYRLEVTVAGQTYAGAVGSFATAASTTTTTPPAVPPGPQTPRVATGTATKLTSATAQLNGTVNPQGPTAVTYHFLYGTASTRLSRVTRETRGPSGSTARPVASPAAGLSARKKYYFRLVVSVSGKSYAGAVRSFTTPAPRPAVVTGRPVRVTGATAVVRGVVNPRGLKTTYHVEFGRTRRYGHSSARTVAGRGRSSRTLRATLSGLTPGTVYHYRFVASSAAGTVIGVDRTLRTPPPPPPPPRLVFSVDRNRSLRAALANGLAVHFTCGRACSAFFDASPVLNGAARVAATPVTLARGSANLRSAGSGQATLQFTSSARQLLSQTSSISLVITGYAMGRGGSRGQPRNVTVTLS